MSIIEQALRAARVHLAGGGSSDRTLNDIGLYSHGAETAAALPQAEGGDVDYRGEHSAPGPDSGSPMYDLRGVYPEDVYSHKGFQYYGDTGVPYDRENFNKIMQAKAKPFASTVIYRAVPKKTAIKEISPGDWVSTNRKYAEDHGESALNGTYKILTKRVHARDLFTAGDSHHEWGYHPQQSIPRSGRRDIENISRKTFGLLPIDDDPDITKADGGPIDAALALAHHHLSKFGTAPARDAVKSAKAVRGRPVKE